MGRTAFRDPRDRTTDVQVCAHPDCLAEGLHPAPKSRNRLHDYYWFCKQHAREYNAAWDFCRGLGQAEIDGMIRHDTVWGRPTWPLGMQQSTARTGNGFTIHDTTGLFEEGADSRTETDPPASASPVGSEIWAMRAMQLSHPLTLTALKARYKELAKRHHPDLNRGDAEAEERLKRINLAYATLRSRLTTRPG